MVPDVEVTVVMRFPYGYEPEEEEVRDLVENQWLGWLTDYDIQEV